MGIDVTTYIGVYVECNGMKVGDVVKSKEIPAGQVCDSCKETVSLPGAKFCNLCGGTVSKVTRTVTTTDTQLLLEEFQESERLSGIGYHLDTCPVDEIYISNIGPLGNHFDSKYFGWMFEAPTQKIIKDEVKKFEEYFADSLTSLHQLYDSVVLKYGAINYVW
jgi:hypothetical protein